MKKARRHGRNAPWLAVVEAAISSVTAVAVAQMRSPRRGPQRVARARQLAAYVGHVGSRVPIAEVAAALGRDRSTLSHACRAVEQRRDDPSFDAAVTLLERGLGELSFLVRMEGRR